MKPVIAVVGAGMMGSAVGKRLVEHGLQVLTPLDGRSDASRARARAAGMEAITAEQAATADLVLSIIPPGEAVSTAERLAPLLGRANKKPIYVDCNAVNPETAGRISTVITEAGLPFVDSGIIGGPPRPDYAGPAFYASGAEAPRFAELASYGLDVRVLDGPPGAASALKMSYAGITKGFTALGAVMMLGATRGGAAAALHKELSQSQPQLFAWLTRQMPQMYSKAYRWVAEMEEIAGFVDEDKAGRRIFEGATQLYERIAGDFETTKREVDMLTAFIQGKS